MTQKCIVLSKKVHIILNFPLIKLLVITIEYCVRVHCNTSVINVFQQNNFLNDPPTNKVMGNPFRYIAAFCRAPVIVMRRFFPRSWKKLFFFFYKSNISVQVRNSRVV